MKAQDRFLVHRGRSLAITLDEVHKPAEASMVTELLDRLEELLKPQAGLPVDPETVTIEKHVFRNLFETAALFNFLIDNLGRLSFGVSGSAQNPEFRFSLNPPGRRQQFLREDVIKALIAVREQLKTPQYG